MQVTMQMKSAFLDRQKVIKSVDKATRRAMFKSLAYIRRGARSGLRRRKRASKPGQSPSVHTSDRTATLKNILFAYDARTKSGIVGPVKLNGRSNGVRNSATVPSTLEFGGTLTFEEESYSGKAGTWRQVRKNRRSMKKMKRRRRRVVVAARPNIGPTLQKESAKGNILSPWANIVKE